jgi:NTE family protein
MVWYGQGCPSPRATEMKKGQPVQEWQKPLAFLAEAPLGWLMPHATISHFPSGSPVCADGQNAEWAFLVLSGSCEQRLNPPDAEPKVLRTFKRGETFGGFLRHDTTVVAAEDSSVLRIRLRDLADIAPKIDGNGFSDSPETSDTTRFTFKFNAPKGKIVTLAFFSALLPEKFLVENIARRLRFETGSSVALVRLMVSADEDVDCDLSGKFVLPDELRETEAGFHLLRVGVSSEQFNPEVLSELCRILRYRFDYVLLDAPAERIPMAALFECIAQSRTAYFFLRRNSEDFYHLDLLLHELRPSLKTLAPVELKSVLCLAESEATAGFDAQIERIGVSTHNFIRGCPTSANTSVPTGSFHADIRRIARGIGNCLVGLALSSGAAKGFSHIGVLQVLEENGIEADVIAGASMGAYVAATWAYGCDGAKMEKLAREMEGKWALWHLIDPAFPPRQGFLRGYAVKRHLQRTIGDAQFSDLVRPLLVLATNLDTLGRVVFSSGDVAAAVHTSIAVPGIFVPVRIGDDAFIDGGIVDPLPTDVLQEMGIRKIIAVNAIPSSDSIRACLQAQREVAGHAERRTRKLAQKFLSFNQHVNYFARGNILEILMQSIHGAQIRMAEASSRRANIVLRPDVGDDRWLDFKNPGQYIQAGRDIARRHLDEIKALVQEKGKSYESKPAPESLATIA